MHIRHIALAVALISGLWTSSTAQATRMATRTGELRKVVTTHSARGFDFSPAVLVAVTR